MSVEDFKECARHELGDIVDSWDEVVIRPLIEFGEWFKNQNDTIKWIFGGLASAGGASALAWIARIVGVAAAEVVLPIIVAFAGGVSIGSGLIIVVQCADRL
jgi:hypothetical protein